MQVPGQHDYGQKTPEGRSRDRYLALAIGGFFGLFAGLLVAGATHNRKSVLIPIGIVLTLAGLTCLLTGAIMYVTKGRDLRRDTPIPNLPIPGWYLDSAGETRWWDGSAWTSFTAAQSPPVHAESPLPPSPPT